MGMAHALGLEVVAEDVETAVQLEFLAELGCHQAQSYLFSPPIPAEMMRDRFASGHARDITAR
jgi:EAL domain-containing protein (putative c-di-GMP-specific phosphodiesterase class I)